MSPNFSALPENHRHCTPRVFKNRINTITSMSALGSSLQIFKRQADESWDFRKNNGKSLTHGLHTYPAMMIAPVAKRLIETYGVGKKTILDPFMGSGTVLVEAATHNFNVAYGLDINPLALLISKAKTTPISGTVLRKEFSRLTQYVENSKGKKIDIPNFKNIDFWFSPKVIQDLVRIKKAIDTIENEKVRTFFVVAFSETTRAVSYTRKSEYKLYKMSVKQLEKFSPDTVKEFSKLVEKNIGKMEEYIKVANDCQTKILYEDTRVQTSIPKKSIDLIVTSPPYGDSRTTVAYGQFSRLALQWLNYDQEIVKNIDKVSLGGIPTKTLEIELDSPTLQKTIDEIKAVDESRAKDVLSFYQDFFKCVIELHRVLADDATLCFVVGNRTVKKFQIPTDKIITELFQSVGNYKHQTTIVRNIPSKRLPRKNSPSNIPGDLVSTMNHEYIVILKKQA